MKRNTLKILIVLLIVGNCFCSQNASADTSLVGVAISKDALIYIGAVADDKPEIVFVKPANFLIKNYRFHLLKNLLSFLC